MSTNVDDDEEDTSNVIDDNTVKNVTSPSPSPHHDDSGDDPHAAQWERQGVWLSKLRAQKNELEKQGIKGFDLLEAMATLAINHKLSILQDHRCHRCWHDKSQNHCICEALQSLLPTEEEDSLSTRSSSLLLPTPYTIKLCILMHHKEYYCAGNSAKLLLYLLPNHTELYLFGKQGEVDRLLRDISTSSDDGNNSRNNTMMLWPGDSAISVSEFLKKQQEFRTKNHRDDEDDDTTRTRNPLLSDDDPRRPPLLRINAIVLDGTYNQARNMHKSLRKRWGKDQNMPVSVALRPSTSSVFHRAQKNYGKAHQQQASSQEASSSQSQETLGGNKVLRVSTAEACGLLLTEMGANKKIQEAITEAVLLNNRALDYARKSSSSSTSK